LTDPPRNTGDLLALSTKKTFIALVQGKIDRSKTCMVKPMGLIETLLLIQ
jgi:hypothetical protein